MDDSKAAWFYVSFAGRVQGKDTFLGGCVVRIPESQGGISRYSYWKSFEGNDSMLQWLGRMATAAVIERIRELGIDPGGEAQMIGPIPPQVIEDNMPKENRERLLTLEEFGTEMSHWH